MHYVGCNIIIFAYRGYSDSTGKPTEKGIIIDGLAILEYSLNLEEID